MVADKGGVERKEEDTRYTLWDLVVIKFNDEMEEEV